MLHDMYYFQSEAAKYATSIFSATAFTLYPLFGFLDAISFCLLLHNPCRAYRPFIVSWSLSLSEIPGRGFDGFEVTLKFHTSVDKSKTITTSKVKKEFI